MVEEDKGMADVIVEVMISRFLASSMISRVLAVKA